MQVEIQDSTLAFLYTDNGNGMSEDALTKLFDPFYTTKRGQGGSGLGAHIVYNLVTDLLNGKICADSPNGKGLRYQLELPLDLT